MGQYREGTVDNTTTKSRQDVHFEKMSILEWVIEDIKSKSEGATALKRFLEENVKNLELTIKKSILDVEMIDKDSQALEWLGVSLSCETITANDLQKHRARTYSQLEPTMDFLIAGEEKQEPIDTAVYES